MARYFFRLDDVAPNMNWENFYWLRELFMQHSIKPLLAVIPDNQDAELLKYPGNPDFWAIISELRHDGFAIGQHGYEHLYKTQSGGVLAINKKGEFAGLDLGTQKSMIDAGREIIKGKLLFEPDLFVAPGHSFDRKTARALRKSSFRYLSDGIGLYPFKKWGVTWLPQIFWKPRCLLFGMITIALHPNTMTKEDLEKLQKFIEKNKSRIGNFSELMEWREKTGFFTKFFTFFINQMFKVFWRIAFKIRSTKHEIRNNIQ